MRRGAFVLACAVHVVAIFGLSHLTWTQDLRGRFLPEDPAVADLERESRIFGSNDRVAILVESSTRLEELPLVEHLTAWRKELSEIPGITGVITFLDLPTFVWDTPRNWHLDALRSDPHPLWAAYRHPLARQEFLRRDGTGTVITISLDPQRTRNLLELRAIRTSLLDWIEAQSGPYRLTLAGGLSFFHLTTIDESTRDLLVIAGPLVLLCLAILSWTFSLRCAVLILALGVMNIMSTMGTAGLLGWQISQFSLIAVPVVLVTSLLDNIHIAYGYCHFRQDGLDRPPAVAAAFRRLLTPCLWTSLTTLAGFGALLLSTVPRIRQFGALCMIGTGWALLSSFALLLPLLARTDPSCAERLRTTVTRLSRAHHPRVVLMLTLVAMVATMPGLARLRIHADFPRLFGNRHPVTKQLERIERDWGGMATVSYLLTPKQPLDPAASDVVSRLRDFVGLLASRELVTSVASPVDLLSLAEQTYMRRFGRRPSNDETRSMLEGFLSGKLPLAQRAALSSWVHPGSRTLRIVARVRMMRPEAFPSLAADLEGFKTNLEDLFNVGMTGWPLLYKNLERRLLQELFQGFAIAFLAVGLLLLLALASWRWWLLAIFVNVTPLWLVLGALGLSGKGFSSELIVAPAVALGLVVDDTIHFLVGLRRCLANHPSHLPVPGNTTTHGTSTHSHTGTSAHGTVSATPGKMSTRGAIAETLAETGTPITITSAVLAAGLSTLFLSVFRGNQWLAGVMVAIVTLAWLADVVLLPALLLLWKSRDDVEPQGSRLSSSRTATAPSPSRTPYSQS